MQNYYGEMMPLRILDEIKFWKRQEAEHTVVIRQIVKDLEEEYVEALKKWEESFAEIEARSIRYIETVIRAGGNINSQVYQGIVLLIQHAYFQSKQFLKLLHQLISESKAVSNNSVAIVVINHIRRESEYFIGIAQTVVY